jgi:hypothetical protein
MKNLRKLFVVSNCVNACQNLGQHILVLEGDNDVFIEVLEPFFMWTFLPMN